MSILYKEIANEIKKYIEAHKNITKLQTERELSIKYNVSRQTIRKAISLCETEGILEKRHGSGIYLTKSYITKINKAAIMVPDSEDYMYPQIISDLEERFRSVNISLNVYSTNNSLEEEKKILDSLNQEPVSTLIVIQSRNALPSPFSDKYQLLSHKGTNIIFLGNPCPNLNEYSYIKFDDFYSGYNVAKRINENENNWCAIFLSDSISSIDRYYGFIQYMSDNNRIFREENIHWLTNEQLKNIKSGNNTSINSIIDHYPVIPSIFICSYDEIAYNLVTLLKNTKKLNDDTRFYSFENSYLQRITDRRIHFYNGDKSQLYSKIIELTLQGKKNEKEVITLPSTLVL